MSASLVVLTYHRVAADARHAAAVPALVSSTADVFERQMRHLERSFDVLGPADVIHAMTAGRLPRRAAMITFDDAYDDFGDVAWPILKRFGFPVTLFVPTSFADEPERTFWWDRLSSAIAAFDGLEIPRSPIGPLPLHDSRTARTSIRRLKDALMQLPHDDAMAWVESICRFTGDAPAGGPSVLGWDALRALAEEGVSIGAHSRTHPLLTRVSHARAAAEIRGSRDDVRRAIGRDPVSFCYPAGACDDAVVDLVRETGFGLAFTCERGLNTFPFRDPLRLRRIDVTQRTGNTLFRLRLMHGMQLADRLQHRMRMDRRSASVSRLLRAHASVHDETACDPLADVKTPSVTTRGTCVAIIGPDGVGKSTIVGMLKDALSDRADFAKVGLHSREFDGHSKAARWLHRLERALGLALRTRRSLARGRPVIWDRHPAEDAVTRKEGRRVLTRGHGWLRRLFPAPDLIIVLDAPEQRLFERRQEQTMSELQRLRGVFLEFAVKTPGAVIIDAGAPVHEVFEAVLREVTRGAEFAR